jgi:APA family basic amino acid/polyamine antiporter
VRAILLQGVIASLFAASGSYEGILGYFAFVDYAFFSLAVFGVFILRRAEPDLPRPYRVWGYPFTPLLFLTISAVYLVTVLHSRPLESLVGLALTLSGLPFYRYWSGRSKASVPPAR